MTTNARASKIGLIVTLILASAMSAVAAPRAPTSDDAQEVDRIRAAVSANAEKAVEKQGGSRILFKVDAGALHKPW